MLAELDMSFFCSLIWTVNVAGLAIECLFLGFIVYSAFLALLPKSCSLGYVFLNLEWNKSNGGLSGYW